VWNDGAPEETFAPSTDAPLRARYARWRALMLEATGI